MALDHAKRVQCQGRSRLAPYGMDRSYPGAGNALLRSAVSGYDLAQLSEQRRFCEWLFEEVDAWFEDTLGAQNSWV